jgi:hypothetical protein
VVDDAELVPVRVAQYDEVGVVGIWPIVHSRRAQAEEAVDVPALLVGIEIQVQPNRLSWQLLRELQGHR